MLWMVLELMISHGTVLIHAILKCHYNLIIQLKSWWLQGILSDSQQEVSHAGNSYYGYLFFATTHYFFDSLVSWLSVACDAFTGLLMMQHDVQSMTVHFTYAHYWSTMCGLLCLQTVKFEFGQIITCMHFWAMFKRLVQIWIETPQPC